MKKRVIIISSIVILVFCLILDNSCQKEKDTSGIVIKKKKLSGLVQKGPYTESSISLYELSPALERTGNSFISATNGSGGSYEIDNVSLSSQIAELKANGYYFNEITGAISPNHLSLNALSDIKDISRVNINLLTHLEVERVKYLVKKGNNFISAKDTAQKEILSVFGFSFVGMDKSEKLDINVNSEENAILLAISVIFQGDRSVMDLTELLNYVSNDMQKDGKLDSDSILHELRGSTLKLDLVSIRLNLENRYKKLAIPVSIPDFEKYVTRFLSYTGLPPSNQTMPATNITSYGATLNGIVSANDLPTTVTFEYGMTPVYGSEVQASPGLVNGHTSTAVIADITGLSPDTTYHLRIKTMNSRGTVYGNDITFRTLGKIPSTLTQPATDISIQEATLNGTINANDLNTTINFEYGLSETYSSTVNGSPGLISGNSDINSHSVISGLSTGTLYHFRVKAVNALGTNFGKDLTFTTLGKIPTVETLAPSDISTEGATLYATVNANDLNTTVSFEFGTSVSYGTTYPGTPELVTGHLYCYISSVLTGLFPNTFYHFRVKATNELGTVYGDDVTFKLLGGLPSVVISPPNRINGISATLNGNVNANYFSTTVTFEYGESASYGNVVSADQNPVTDNINTNVSASVSGLNSETEYHFRVKAVNVLGTSYSEDIAFKTPQKEINDIDGNSYSAVSIGNQIWMGENLRTTKYNDGTPVQMVTDNIQWSELAAPAYCWYNNDETEYKYVYGALYNWYVADTIKNGDRNVCPVGWHVPSFDEWLDLINFIGGTWDENKLMETGTSHWAPPNSSATNETLFTALPGGYRDAEEGFGFEKVRAYFITSSLFGNYNIGEFYSISIYEDGNPVMYIEYNTPMSSGRSIRCIKD